MQEAKALRPRALTQLYDEQGTASSDDARAASTALIAHATRPLSPEEAHSGRAHRSNADSNGPAGVATASTSKRTFVTEKRNLASRLEDPAQLSYVSRTYDAAVSAVLDGASVGSDERLAELGRALGRQRIEKGSLCAIRAVIASRSGVTKTDREAWEAYGTTKGTFKDWKKDFKILWAALEHFRGADALVAFAAALCSIPAAVARAPDAAPPGTAALRAEGETAVQDLVHLGVG